MGESSTPVIISTDGNVSRPHAPSLVADDDDEPPSSNCTKSTPPVSEVTAAREPVPPYLPSPGQAVIHNRQPSSTISYGGVKPFFTRRRTLTSDIENDGTDKPFSGNKVATNSQNPLVHAQRGQPRNSKLSRLGMLFRPTRPLGPPPTYAQSFKAVLSYNYLNFCIAFIPISWALHYSHQSPTLIFVFSALGIIPLAALLGFGTEQIALRTSASVGGMLNATLGNIVELIIAGIALGECKLELVQSSLLGGLLSNLLLVLGMAFIVGGYRYSSQEFQPMVAQINSSLMTASVMALIVPAGFHEFVGDRLRPGQEVDVVLQLSRGSSVILMLIYFAYLVFQFYSHSHLFLEVSPYGSMDSRSTSFARFSTFESQTLPAPTVQSKAPTETDGIHQQKLNVRSALFLVVLVTILAYFTAECLVDSLEGLIESHPNISQEWITLIIIPVISNAAEHTTAVVVATKGKFDLAMGVAVGSCIQIALFVIPLLVLVAWGMDKPLTLLFDPLETLVLFLSILLVKFAIEDGRSHWMSGTVLVCVYVLIALSFWNFPESVRVLQGTTLTC